MKPTLSSLLSFSARPGDLLYAITDARLITPSHCGERFPKAVMVSTVTPSLKNSCSGLPPRLSNGSTAITILFFVGAPFARGTDPPGAHERPCRQASTSERYANTLPSFL